MKVCPLCGKEYSDTSTLCTLDAEVLQSLEDPLVGQTLAEKYLIEELIKRGGMGAVYRGKHVMMDKTVAIKVLRPALAGDDAVVARFSREAKAASRISHPHAVSVTDFGESENGVVFLVMEYLDGRTLKDIIRSEGPLPLDRIVEIIRQVSGALDAAHHQGVVHRDLKSDNIMLSQTNGGDWAKVLDFGIAKIQQPEGARDNDITAANLVIGTPQYMSPEQCSQSGPIDARSDVYSLGVIVFEMLSGRVPFTGESPTVIMMKQVQDDPPSIRELRPDLPAGVDSLIKKALAKQPIDRFQTAGELYEALTTAAAGASEAEAATVVPPVGDTVANEPVHATADDLDEVTVVRPRAEATPVSLREIPVVQTASQPSLANFNPWRILAPAAIVLVAVFGVVFLMTRGTSQTPTNQAPGQTAGQPLAADPNGQPVQPTGTPTGAGERGIQASSSATPLSRNSNASATPTVVPGTASGDFGSNDNSNKSVPANKNANQREAAPKPSPTVDKDEPPSPKPSPSIRNPPKPAITPPG
ncbi:MAG: eukaryotic-like serine/threonine-protein kinase [Blastocatellia bacterium]|jgi:serine/threonine-protein kinase|nr:eukaryotic-like serine/threonine-protein kinase [Blastocatellia bacterium]